MNVETSHRRPPDEAARVFVEQNFPEASLVLLAGSAARGQVTSTSDIDIVLLGDGYTTAFRRSFEHGGWPIEVFAYDFTNYEDFIADDIRRREPALAAMIADGVVLRDGLERAPALKSRAVSILTAGPPACTSEEIMAFRYFITELSDDLADAHDVGEAAFLAFELGNRIATFHLALNRRWLGRGKWLARALREFERDCYETLVSCLTNIADGQSKARLLGLAASILQPVGGPLRAGFGGGK